jgi:hypothetical protein
MADDMGTDEPLGRAEFWQRAAAFAFAAWALALPLAAAAVIGSIGRFTDKFDAYVLAMERRITLLEERQSRVLQVLEQHEARLDRQAERLNGLPR